MIRFLADVAHVARYELGEAVRTRLLQLVLLGYCGGIAFADWMFVELLGQLEASLASTMGVPATKRPGAMVGQLVKDGQLSDVFGAVVGREDVGPLLDRPVLALWTGAAAMVLLPLVMLFSASGSIAGEVRSRSVRYLLCRTGRLQIGLGKLVGQLLLALLAAVLGSVVAWVVGMTLMVGNPPAALALELLNRTVRAAIFALPFAGLGLCASQWVASPNGARFVGGALLAAMAIADAWLGEHVGPDLLGRLADLAVLFLATDTWASLWTTSPLDLQVAAARCAGLAVVYYAGGHVVFARKDL